MRIFRRAGARERGSGEGPPAPSPPYTSAPLLTSSARQACRNHLVLALLLGLAASLTGCSYYSFSGATIPQEYETIAILPIENATATPLRDLEGALTDLLNERFVERTRLRLTTDENEADVVLTGRLTQYDDAPTAVGGDERATRNEVTIRAEVRYYERESGEDLLNETYTQSETYDLSSTSESAETAASAVLEEIADAVFADATSNW